MIYRLKIQNKSHYWRGHQASCEYCGDQHYDSEYCDTCGRPPCRCNGC